MRPVAFVVLTAALLSSTVAVQERPALATDAEKRSYALGMDLGTQLRDKKVAVDAGMLARGLADALSGSTLLMTEEESHRVIASLQDEIQRRELARIALDAEKNQRDGEAFLAANKAKEGVVTLPSGLQYRVLSTGTGRKPTVDDTVTCHYRGVFINGTEFDSSYSRGEPATFAVKNVVKGWSEALQLMPAGSKWQLFIPPELAYGSRGASGRIAPNSTLVFDVELVAVK
jgi:FKBP-type peptidyl-prolyl cis-trans isomerase FklB